MAHTLAASPPMVVLKCTQAHVHGTDFSTLIPCATTILIHHAVEGVAYQGMLLLSAIAQDDGTCTHKHADAAVLPCLWNRDSAADTASPLQVMPALVQVT